MATLTDTDIKELKEFINSRFEKLGKHIEDLDKKIDTKIEAIEALDKKLDVYIAKTDEQLKTIQKDLRELKQQIDKQDTRPWVMISGLFLALFGMIARYWFLPGNL